MRSPMRKFIAAPATSTSARFHAAAFVKALGSPEASSSPSMAQKPPIGTALSVYSVSPRFRLKSTGPMPMANSLTRMPRSFATESGRAHGPPRAARISKCRLQYTVSFPPIPPRGAAPLHPPLGCLRATKPAGFPCAPSRPGCAPRCPESLFPRAESAPPQFRWRRS